MNPPVAAGVRQDILSIKSWLFTPATKSDRFDCAAQVRAGALIIDLEDTVAPADKEQALSTAISYLEAPPPGSVPCALRINTPHSKLGVDDLAALLASKASPRYVVIPTCDSAGAIALVVRVLREAGKSTEVITLIESVTGEDALGQMARHPINAGGLRLRSRRHGSRPRRHRAAWQPLLYTRSRIVRVAAGTGIAALDSPFFDIADEAALRQETRDAAAAGLPCKMRHPPGASRAHQRGPDTHDQGRGMGTESARSEPRGRGFG